MHFSRSHSFQSREKKNPNNLSHVRRTHSIQSFRFVLGTTGSNSRHTTDASGFRVVTTRFFIDHLQPPIIDRSSYSSTLVRALPLSFSFSSSSSGGSSYSMHMSYRDEGADELTYLTNLIVPGSR
mmetsp:Transcript_30509/g.63947  ORF Transcript_30509/g.63947 Transcript_30509/m.63947 type:complete len:125 (-) Transcript_30509:739-1113(-)